MSYCISLAGIVVPLFVVLYIIIPRFVHRFVGYLEEEAVITYTKCLEVCTDDSSVAHVYVTVVKKRALLQSSEFVFGRKSTKGR